MRSIQNIFHSVGNSNLHTGQVLCYLSQGFKQSGWKIWPQGNKFPSYDILKSSTHTVHLGNSIFTDPLSYILLQCSSPIFTNGIFFIASSETGFCCGLFIASNSLKYWAKSNIGSEFELRKLEWKLFLKLVGLKLKKDEKSGKLNPEKKESFIPPSIDTPLPPKIDGNRLLCCC